MPAAALTALSVLLVMTIGRAERELKLRDHVSDRYRMHALPVALSQMYGGRVHDYTAYPAVASSFLNRDIPLDTLLAYWAREGSFENGTVKGEGDYFWEADDRGLSDYVALAFTLFGPRIKSLSYCYSLVLLISLALYTLAYWRQRIALLLPPLLFFGILCLAYGCGIHTKVPLVNGEPWGERVGLFEPRMFEALALLAALHLALFLGQVERPRALDWAAVLGQALLLLFLYHARSSLGWIYVALFFLAGIRLLTQGWNHLTRREKPANANWPNSLAVAAVLAGSIFALKTYKSAMYHPAYFAERGGRTFWHNALIGFNYHPALRSRYHLSLDDAPVFNLIYDRTVAANDSRVSVWKFAKPPGGFAIGPVKDWDVYEKLCKEAYEEIWRQHAGEVLECYVQYKPADLARFAGEMARQIHTEQMQRPSPTLMLGGLAVGLALLISLWAGYRQNRFAAGLRLATGSSLVLLLFSGIPGVAFYIGLPTISAFLVLLVLVLPLAFACLVHFLGQFLSRGKARTVLDSKPLNREERGIFKAA